MVLEKFGHPWVDETHAPIFICSPPPSPTDEALDGYIARLEAWTQVAQEKYAWIVVPAKLNTAQRKAMMAAQARQIHPMKMYQTRVAFVVTNPVIRSVLSAIFLFAPPPVPYMVCSTMGEALWWAKKKGA